MYRGAGFLTLQRWGLYNRMVQQQLLGLLWGLLHNRSVCSSSSSSAGIFVSEHENSTVFIFCSEINIYSWIPRWPRTAVTQILTSRLLWRFLIKPHEDICNSSSTGRCITFWFQELPLKRRLRSDYASEHPRSHKMVSI